jgi:DNA-directed RNA polymerase subunit RPC12/RpoP
VYVVLGLVLVAAVLWIVLGVAWASSVASHMPELRDGAQQVRYGWRCPRCGKTHTPNCKASNCGGPLVWVQRETTIKCARCHRRFIPHPLLFRRTPRSRHMWCSGCRKLSFIREWKIR